MNNAPFFYGGAAGYAVSPDGTRFAERRDPVAGAILRAWVDGDVLPAFASRVLAADLAVARCWPVFTSPTRAPTGTL